MQAHQLVQAVRLQGREDAAEVDLLRRASQPGPPGAGADVQDARLLQRADGAPYHHGIAPRGAGHPVAGDLSLPPVFVNKQQAVDRDGAFCTDAQRRRPLSSPNIAQKNFAVNIDKRRGFLYTVL